MDTLKNTVENELITVIVPIFRVEKYINQCIESIINQTYRKLEIVLVDDGTDDLCSCVCDSTALSDSRIITIHKTNGGLSDARNKGLDLMQGEFVAFIDSDDWVEINYLDTLLDVLYSENADVVSCGEIYENENTEKSELVNRKYFSVMPEQALRLLYDQTQIMIGAVKLYKRNIWRTLRFPYGKLYEDLLTTYKVFDNAKRIVQIPERLYHYRIREGSIMATQFSLKVVGISDAWKENYIFCKKQYPSIAPLARMFWLETIPSIIVQFPKKMNKSERKAKKQLKKEIISNAGFIIRNMPLKKIYYLARAVCFQ